MVFERLEAELTLDTSNFEAGISDANSSLDSLGSRTHDVGSSVQDSGRTLTRGLTVPLAGVAGASAKMTADFEQDMQNSISVMGDVDSAMRDKLEDSARDVARNTTVSHGEAAESFYFLASAGLDTAEALEAMPTVAALAEAGNMDMADATDTATNIMGAYGLEAEEMADVTDVLTETTNNHNQTMDGMADAFKNAAPTAAGLGIGMHELAAATGILGDVGIQGAEAGTALSSIMRRMATRSGEAGEALDRLGIETTDANGNLLPMADIMGQLEDANLSAADKAAIFGNQLAAGNALLDAGQDDIEGYTEDIEDSEGATQEMADTQRDTLRGSLQLLKSAFTDVGITIGDVFADHIREAVDRLTDLAHRFQELSPEMIRMIVVVGAVVAAIGPFLMAIGTALMLIGQSISAISTMISMFSGLLTPISMAAKLFSIFSLSTLAVIGPVLLLIGIIAALGAAVATNFAGIRGHIMRVVEAFQEHLLPIFQQFGLDTDEILETVTEAWNHFMEVLEPILERIFEWIADRLIDAIILLAEILPPILERIQTGFQIMSEMVILAVQHIYEYFMIIWPLIEEIITLTFQIIMLQFEETWPYLREAFFVIMNAILTVVEYVWPTIRLIIVTAIQTISEIVIRVLHALRETFQIILQTIQDDNRSAWDALKQIISIAINLILDIIRLVFNAILTVVLHVLDELEAGARVAWAAIRELISTALGIIETTVTDIWNAIKTFVFGILEDLRSEVDSVWETIRSLIDTALNSIQSLVNTILSAIRSFMETTWSAIQSFIDSTLNTIQSTIDTVWSEIQSFIQTTLSNIRSAVNTVWNAILSFIRSTLNTILSTIRSVWNTILSTIRTALSNIVSAVRTGMSNALSAIRTAMSNILSAIRTGMSNALSAVRTGINNMVSALRSAISRFRSAGSALMGAVVSGLKSKAKDAINAVKNTVSRAESYLPGSDADRGPLSDLTDVGPDFIDTIAGGIDSNSSNLENAAAGIAEMLAMNGGDAELGENLDTDGTLKLRKPTENTNNKDKEVTPEMIAKAVKDALEGMSMMTRIKADDQTLERIIRDTAETLIEERTKQANRGAY